MNYMDYYQVLGVPQTATTGEINSAYHKLALKYHPDKNRGDRDAVKKFTDINDAHEVLGDPEKRKKYDQFGADYRQYEQSGAQAGGFDWSKYAAGGGGQSHRMSGEEFESMFSGNDEGVDLFELLFGARSGRRRGRRSAAVRGEDLNAETTISLEEAYHGTARLINIDGQTIRVAIAKGIGDQQVLRVAGKGAPGWGGGENGDLYLTVKIAPDPEFHRRGNDLHGGIPVELYTAMLGGKALVKTFKGAVKVDIPAETPNGKELRLRGLGMPVFGSRDGYGDLFVTVDLQIPEHLSRQETDLFRKLSALRK